MNIISTARTHDRKPTRAFKMRDEKLPYAFGIHAFFQEILSRFGGMRMVKGISYFVTIPIIKRHDLSDIIARRYQNWMHHHMKKVYSIFNPFIHFLAVMPKRMLYRPIGK